MELEYLMFSQENPADTLKDLASTLNLSRKRKIAPYIRRTEALVRKSQSFRNILMSEQEINDVIATAFVQYFDKKVSRGNFIAIARDPSFEFVKFVSGLMKDGIKLEDKYLRRVNTIILNNSDAIDSFIKAFLSIRQTKGELDKLLLSQ